MLSAPNTPTHLWIVGGLATLWNAGGAFDFLMTQFLSDSYLADMPETQRSFVESFPAVVIGAWAVATLGGLAGSLLLLARSRHAVIVYAVSLAGLLIAMFYQFAILDRPPEMTSPPILAFTIAVCVIAVALLYYSWRMNVKGVLR